MPILLALTSAIVYGVADYCGGRASRFHPSAVVTALGQAVSLVMVTVVVLAAGTAVPGVGTFGWGLAAGIAGATGLASLYHGFSHGSMTVVAPISAVVGVSLPVIAGLVDGERPDGIAYVGIVLALPAVALVSGAIGKHDRPTSGPIIGFAVLAGVGFGTMFVALARTDPDSGMWPLVAARLGSVPFLLGLCVVTGVRPGRQTRLLLLAVVAGVLDMAANLTYLEATRRGLLSIVAVVSSLYPASTVMLAFLIDRERVDRWQTSGMVLAASAVVLVTLGR